MEFCSGGDLFDRILKVGYFCELDAALIFKPIVEAINYLHSKNIVHRDVKLENFIFSDQNKYSCIKLIDFGVSKKLEKKQKSCNKKFVKMTTIIGTPEYMSPEIITGSYNDKCDVWSLGIILHLLLVGYFPFTGDT